MKNPRSLLKIAAVISSVLLVGGFVSFQAGAFNRLMGTSSPPTQVKIRPYLPKEQIEGSKSREIISSPPEPSDPTRSANDGDGLLLHSAARNVGPRARWGWAEDWIELRPDEWASFVPAADAKVGTSWQIDGRPCSRLFATFFPPVPNYKPANTETFKIAFTATVTETSDEKVSYVLQGRLTMNHRMGGTDTDGQVDAKLLGLVSYDKSKKALVAFRLAAEEATFSWHWEGKELPTKFEVGVEMGKLTMD